MLTPGHKFIKQNVTEMYQRFKIFHSSPLSEKQGQYTGIRMN